MIYKLTLLKDLQIYKNGKVIHLKKGLTVRRVTPEIAKDCFGSNFGFKRNEEYVIGLMDDPEWVKKEADFDNTVPTHCPHCGFDRFFPGVRKFKENDCDVTFYKGCVTFECANCGKMQDVHTFDMYSKVDW